MDIKWIKTFIITAKFENFRKASEELFLTQPAVTKHIKRLEENLNIQLFERIGNKVALTPAGHKFLSYAREFLIKYEQGMNDFESWKQGYNRKLVIATAPQIASSFLPSLVRHFVDENPNIEVIINVLKSYDIGEEISVGRADIGLTRLLPLQKNIKTNIVHIEPVILVGPNEYKEATHLDEQTIIHKYRLITHNHPDYWDTLLNDIKRHYPTVRTMKVNQIEVTKRFIEEGLGVSYLPFTVIKNEISMKELVEIKSNKITPPTSYTYALTKVETDEVSNFINFLMDTLSEL
ncbi:LysR family transcriptional repressor of citA [Cytobacillus oceanisediminis]|uniref:LysR family transcriptional repressor of citA n=1 Tax=Cytobacillus oceanisediminis TaxID=665099 RepID=A0A2V2ZK36_9BACI|nr:LysR family transcriptional regulator [Cytobacillus oceanisediminis]PWW20305.1 LysR family transcriptional repressor of citA [Cytobacillus oceanisediminis]